MRQRARCPTDFAAVDAVLLDLLGPVKETLGDAFVDLYLYGSLATGSFTPSRSDIDFLVVTRAELPPGLTAALEALHTRLWSSGSQSAAKLEGAYLPIGLLRRYSAFGPSVPTVNEGRFYLAQEGIDWVIQRHVLRESEAIVEGPSIHDWIDPVSPQDLQSAVRALLETWWAPMLTDPSRLSRPGYQAYAILSMCRAVFLLEHGVVVSKQDAAAWALSSLPPQWAALISEAEEWCEGDPESSLSATLAFIRFAIDRGSRSLREDREETRGA